MIDNPGIYKISMEEYKADPCIEPSLSRSIIKTLLFESPAQAKYDHPRLKDYEEIEDEEIEDVKKFDIGTAAHSLILEGKDIIEIIDPQDFPGAKGGIPKGFTTAEMKKERDRVRTQGKIPLLPKQNQRVQRMVLAAEKQIALCPELGIKNLRAEGESELTYIWKEGNTWLKTRPDWKSKDRKTTIDYKTTATSADPAQFTRRLIDGGYDIQESLYRRGGKAIDEVNTKYVFVVQETRPPYLCSFISLPPQWQEIGKQKVDYGIFLWEQCMASGIWPGYPNQVCYPDCPPWAMSQWELIAERIGL